MIPFRSIYFDDPPVDDRCIDLFEAKMSDRPAALFFVHGGGWKSGSRSNFHRIALAFCERGYECACTGYRLRGATVFDQVDDLRQGLSIFATDLTRRGKTADIILIGTSAGAHLALLAALSEQSGVPPYRIAGLCLQATPVTFEPWADIFPAIWENMQSAIGVPFSARPDLYRQASPLHHVRKGIPPTFFLEAEHEHMFPLVLTKLFARKARACGAYCQWKVYPRTEHGFFYGLERRQQAAAFQDILSFLELLEIIPAPRPEESSDGL